MTATSVPANPGVGLIGLGLIGSAVAERLLAANVPVVGYDLDADRRRAAADQGVTLANDARDVILRCDRILLSLTDSSVVRAVLDEVEPTLRPGQLIIDTTTGSPADAIECGRRLGDRGVAYLDATISGSSNHVRSAQAVILAGGDDDAFARCLDLFRFVSRRAYHVGPVGAGSQMKLVTNLVLGLNRAALAEGLALAGALGLDLAATLAVMKDSAAYSRIMDTKGDRMVNRDFTPEARLAQHLKDVRLILAEATAAGLDLPMTEAHRALLESAEAAGLGPLDNSAIIQAIAKRRDPMVRP